MKGSRAAEAQAAPPESAAEASATPLAGIRVHATGLDPGQRDELRRRLQQLGGAFESALDRKHPPHVVIALSTVSDKYQVSARTAGTSRSIAQPCAAAPKEVRVLRAPCRRASRLCRPDGTSLTGASMLPVQLAVSEGVPVVGLSWAKACCDERRRVSTFKSFMPVLRSMLASATST